MSRAPSRLVLACALWCLALLPGCRRAAEADAAAGGTSGNGSGNGSGDVSGNVSGSKSYPIQGKVLGINAAAGEVELDAAAIPGYMDAMAMPYKLRDPAVLSELHAGDTVRARLVVTGSGETLDQIVITGEGKPVSKPTTDLRPLIPGEPVPNFALRNQAGKVVHLGDYRGRLLLITFVYTRCPLADYCPRMSRNFAAVDKALAADPALYARTHLLSVSFDPAYDTPAVLKSYGGAYTGNYTHETFEHWEFAAPSEGDLARVLQFFDVAATPEKDRTVTHSLSTVAIGPDGKVLKWYPTNDWTPAELVGDVKQNLQGKKAAGA